MPGNDNDNGGNKGTLEPHAMNTALTVSHRVAQYIVDTPYAAIPEGSFTAAKRFMLTMFFKGIL